jgi:hypothetical protein
MPVASEWFDPTDSDVDSQIETFENGLSASSIEDREVVDEGQDKFRVIWFYSA